MKEASKIMYTIGKVINIIEIIISVLIIALATVCVVMPDKIAAVEGVKYTAAQIYSMGLKALIALSVSLVIEIVILCFATHAKKTIKKGSQSLAPHIIMIVIGVFGDIFYLLGGIFGLVAANAEQTKK